MLWSNVGLFDFDEDEDLGVDEAFEPDDDVVLVFDFALALGFEYCLPAEALGAGDASSSSSSSSPDSLSFFCHEFDVLVRSSEQNLEVNVFISAKSRPVSYGVIATCLLPTAQSPGTSLEWAQCFHGTT